MTIHDFRADLAFSHSPEARAVFRAAYEAYFPGQVRAVEYYDRDLQLQAKGVDCAVILRNGSVWLVDEKIDRVDNDRIALEYVSNEGTGAVGWVARTHYALHLVAYLKMRRSVVHFLLWPRLLSAWPRHRAEWLRWAHAGEQGCWHARARNREGYYTLSACVPPKLLYTSIVSAGYVTVDASALAAASEAA